MSWAFYISYLLPPSLSNMIIGIVVNVIEEEHQRERHAQLEASGDPTLRDPVESNSRIETDDRA